MWGVIFLMMMLHYVIPNNLKAAQQVASTGWNVFGFIFFILMALPVYALGRVSEQKVKNMYWYIIWFVMLALSFFFPNGFGL